MFMTGSSRDLCPHPLHNCHQVPLSATLFSDCHHRILNLNFNILPVPFVFHSCPSPQMSALYGSEMPPTSSSCHMSCSLSALTCSHLPHSASLLPFCSQSGMFCPQEPRLAVICHILPRFCPSTAILPCIVPKFPDLESSATIFPQLCNPATF
jgi:hypothetical protein